MPNFLHIGCNRKRKDRTTRAFNTPAWNELRLDIDPGVEPDIVASMLDMSSIENQSFDAIFSSHNLEHLHAHEVPVALREFRRVLKDDGFLVVTCPDIQEVCRIVGEGKLLTPLYQSPAGPIAPLDILYGHRRSIADGNRFMAHKCAFTLEVLLETIRDVGFASAAGYRRAHPFYDLWVVATRSAASEVRLKELLAQHQAV